MNVVPYDENWLKLYENEEYTLNLIFGDLIIDIQHFGSTAIIGMIAKPTIDVMVVVRSIDDVDFYNDEMIKQGYDPRGENNIPGRRYFVRFKDDGVNQSDHIHIYGSDNQHIIDELMFRDFLNCNKKAFLKYETMKKEVSGKHLFSSRDYEEAKYDCVMEIMEEARLYYNA
jgi:GrpB-like predicted nucleotidyltransferase (UPF0157 family)